MKALVLFFFFFLISFVYQNCSENPNDFQSADLSLTCTPTDKCLKYSIQLDSTLDQKTAGVCIDTKPTENGLGSDAKFSQGCTALSSLCAYCNLNNVHQVYFSVTSKESKIGIEQSITINFSPDGKAKFINY